MNEKPNNIFKELPKKEKILLLSGIVLVLGAVVSSVLLGRKKAQKERVPLGLGTPLSTIQSRGGSRFVCSSSGYPLRYGSCHKDVRILQGYLIQHHADLGQSGKNRDGIDGRFGAKTARASKKQFGKSTFTPKDIEAMKTTLKKQER